MPKIMLITEQEFTDQVLELAKLYRWQTAHFRPARTKEGWRTPVSGDGKGFPDLILVRGMRVIVAELKVGKNKPTPEQTTWLEAFRQTSVEVYLWYPHNWEEIISVISRNAPLGA